MVTEIVESHNTVRGPAGIIYVYASDSRIVLIVDLWHPDLTPHEIGLLDGLQHYALAEAESLSRYWNLNEEAAR